MNKVTQCPVCDINVYDRGPMNRDFMVRITKYSGYPADTAMPCLMTRPDMATKDNPTGKCPFETDEEQQKLLDNVKNMPKISGKNTYE